MNIDTLTDAAWEIWYQDTFDLDTPRRIEHIGRGLENGLAVLWKHHLLEGVQPGGQTSFARFNLWLKEEKCSIEIPSEGTEIQKLRSWLVTSRLTGDEVGVHGAGMEMLAMLAAAHCRLLQANRTVEPIFLAAENSANRAAFKAELMCLAEDKENDPPAP